MLAPGGRPVTEQDGPAMATSVAEAVAARAAADPDGIALVVDGGADLTFGAWEARSNALGRGLAARGVTAEDRVGLLFDGSRWADFAVAHLGVLKAQAVAVVLSSGAASPDLSRALSHSGAVGLLCAPHLVPAAVSTWAVEPGVVEAGFSADPVARCWEPGALAELVYPAAPLAVPRPWARSHADTGLLPGPVDGCFVHAWAPGSLAGQHGLQLALAGPQTRVATLAAFEPDRLCAMVDRRQAVACALTPVLAAALVASGAAADHDLTSVTQVVLSGPPSPELQVRLREAFPSAAVVEIDPRPRPRPRPRTSAVFATVESVTAPVAVSQEGMLWHEQFTPGSFNLPCLVRRYEGPLDVAALEWALWELVRRHPPLRSTFELVDDEPRQVVGDHRHFALPMVDHSTLEPQDRDAEVARLLADATSRPFDLTTGPLFEPRLVRMGHDDHLLVVRLHHTVFDDWSVDVFRGELSALYTARVAGEPSPLPEPSASFAEFSRRQRIRLGGEAGAVERSWWRRELSGAPLAVQLPIGGPDGAATDQSESGAPVRLDLPPSLAAELRALAPRLRATPYMTVLAAFSVLVARCTDQDDLLMASVVAHRNRSELESLIGCFTKKIPIRIRTESDPTFPELVTRTRAALLGALSHQDVAFDAAVQEALGGAAAEHGVVPQVTVVFQGETPQQVRLVLPGLVTRPYEAPVEARSERHFSAGPERRAGTAGAPTWGDGIYLRTFLILSLLETGDGIALLARGTFHRPAVRRLLERFQALLAGVVEDPHQRVSKLSAAIASPDDWPTIGSEPDVVELRGFRASRSRLEAALATAPGVADVGVSVRSDDDGDPRLVEYVVSDGGASPTLAELRHALWARLPGAPWPAAAVVVDSLPRRPDGSVDAAALPPPGSRVPGETPGPDPAVDLMEAELTAMWSEARGRPARTSQSYWQDFSFLHVLAQAREAGMPISDEQVVRCRTPEMLAAALAVEASSRTRGTAP